MKPRIEELVNEVMRRRQRLRFWWRLAAGWAIGAGLAVLLWGLEHRLKFNLRWAWPVLGLIEAGVLWWLLSRQQTNASLVSTVQLIERQHPELNGRLLTAIQHKPKETLGPGYLQQRLETEILSQHRVNGWRDVIPGKDLRWAQVTHWTAAAAFAFALLGLRSPLAGRTGARLAGVEVTPGDARVERGTPLVVLARFPGALPPSVELVLSYAHRVPEHLPLMKSLADPVFGGTVPEVSDNLLYHIEYAGGHTKDYHVTVFDYPRLQRADASLDFPAYTRQPPKVIENTRRITAVEGSRLGLQLQLNKPVITARLIPTEKGRQPIVLVTQPKLPSATLRQFRLHQSGTYTLQLVDAEGLTNRVDAPFVFAVLPNRPPELRLTTPRGDLRPSPLEEVSFAGTVWDDFGVKAYGVGYSLVGEPTKFIELGHNVMGKETRPFHYLLRLEELGVQPDQLVSWFIWADDTGSDGKMRRTRGDLFFAEIRPFDEIFRQGQGGDSQPGGQNGQSGGRTGRLAQLQKQIISATWNLSRAQTNRSAHDLKTVRDAQAQALAQAKTASARQEDPQGAVLWPPVVSNMQTALDRLGRTSQSPGSMAGALPAEQAAYQSLLRLQEHEFQVSRSRNRGQGGASDQPMQRELAQLDLTQPADRYETQHLAEQPANPQHLEQLHVLNQLQELARRQQDLNQRLQELQTALAEAQTQKERAELERRLKRLQEDEQQMLANVDELRQRMDRPENQSEMTSERRQLDQTRQDVQRAASAAARGAASEALASGTRAQQQLEQIHEQMRKESSSQFADEMRSLRNDARELAREQQAVVRKLEAQGDSQQKSLSDAPDRQALLEQAGHERELLTNLLARAAEISEQAQQPQPLLSRQLYDTLRNFSQLSSKAVDQAQNQLLEQRVMTRNIYNLLRSQSQPDSTKLLDLTTELLRGGFLPQANETGQRVQSGFEQLKGGLEQAAQSVLGDDTEALRLAQQQLRDLTDELQQEVATAQKDRTNSSPATTGSPGHEQANSGKRREAGQAATGTPAESRRGENRGQPSENQLAGNRADSTAERPGGQASGARGAAYSGRGGWRGGSLDQLLQQRSVPLAGPITGGDYLRWSERLSDVEDMLDQPELRNPLAIARERVRVLREQYRRDRKKPDWAVLNQEVMNPLLEVRKQIADELARRESKDAMVPVDRDPVPHQYVELVRRYYEELGRDK